MTDCCGCSYLFGSALVTARVLACCFFDGGASGFCLLLYGEGMGGAVAFAWLSELTAG